MKYLHSRLAIVLAAALSSVLQASGLLASGSQISVVYQPMMDPNGCVPIVRPMPIITDQPGGFAQAVEAICRTNSLFLAHPGTMSGNYNMAAMYGASTRLLPQKPGQKDAPCVQLDLSRADVGVLDTSHEGMIRVLSECILRTAAAHHRSSVFLVIAPPPKAPADSQHLFRPRMLQGTARPDSGGT